MVKQAKRVADFLIQIQYALSVILAVFLVILVVYQVFLRYVLKAPLMGIEELMIFPMIWVYWLGGANASYEKSHIECGILTLYMKKEKTIALFNLCKAVFSLLIGIWIIYWAGWYFNYSLTRWKVSNFLYIPMFIAESSYLVGSVLMSLYALRDVIVNGREFTAVWKKREGGDVE